MNEQGSGWGDERWGKEISRRDEERPLETFIRDIPLIQLPEGEEKINR